MTTILLPLLYFPISFKCCRSTYPPLLSYHRTLGNVSRNYLLISLQSYKLVSNTGAHCSGCYSRSWIRTILAQACLKQIGTKLIIVTIVKRLKTRTWDWLLLQSTLSQYTVYYNSWLSLWCCLPLHFENKDPFWLRETNDIQKGGWQKHSWQIHLEGHILNCYTRLCISNHTNEFS